MFTGLIETTAEVLSLDARGQGWRLVIAAPEFMRGEVALGQSIAVNGCCLTLAEFVADGSQWGFDLLEQTLRVTSLGDLRAGARVNLERAMGALGRFGGHLVQGHVDACVKVLDWRAVGADWRLEIELPAEFVAQVIPKGSIAIDGISLTAAEVSAQSVLCWIIPHTREVTHLSGLEIGRRVNVEYDLIGKYVGRHLAQAGLIRGA